MNNEDKPTLEKTIFNWWHFEDVTCPKCNSKNIAKIQYGLPIWTDEFQGLLDCGKIVLGGCILAPENRRYKCNSCKQHFGRVDDDEVERRWFDKLKR